MISTLKAKRFFAELSIYDIAKKTGIDPARISLFERSFKTPRPDELETLADALNCKPEDIDNRNEGEGKLVIVLGMNGVECVRILATSHEQQEMGKRLHMKILRAIKELDREAKSGDATTK